MRTQRILIQTHHITSRKKIAHLVKAAKRLSCAVLLKTGKSPGLMVAESVSLDGEDRGKGYGGAEEWGELVRNLRYKDFKLLRKEEIPTPGLSKVVELGTVREVESMREVQEVLEECGDGELWKWWRARWMG